MTPVIWKNPTSLQAFRISCTIFRCSSVRRVLSLFVFVFVFSNNHGPKSITGTRTSSSSRLLPSPLPLPSPSPSPSPLLLLLLLVSSAAAKETTMMAITRYVNNSEAIRFISSSFLKYQVSTKMSLSVSLSSVLHGNCRRFQ